MIKSYVGNIIRQWFHFKHEVYTKLAYTLPWLPPYRYVFVLTNQCNMKCKNCFQDKRFNADNALNASQWMALSDSIPAWCRITMTGGEPLIMASFKDIFERVATRHTCNLITNGTLLNEELVKYLLSFPRFKILAVSIDNLKSGGMNLRSYSDKQWSDLERILKYFVKVKDQIKSRSVLEIKTLVLDENADSLFEIHKFCMEVLKADHHTFQFLKGSPFQHADKSCNFEQILEESKALTYKKFDVIINELKKIKDYNIKNKRVAFLHPKVADIHSEKPFNDVEFLNCEKFEIDKFRACPYPWSSVHINYDGEVFPCLTVSMGNLKKDNLRSILKGEARRKFCSVLKKRGLVQACNRCGWLRQAV